MLLVLRYSCYVTRVRYGTRVTLLVLGMVLVLRYSCYIVLVLWNSCYSTRVMVLVLYSTHKSFMQTNGRENWNAINGNKLLLSRVEDVK